MEKSIFTRIIEGEIPCHKIAEDEWSFAFLDIRPITSGHTLVIPKQQVDYFFELGDDVLSDLMIFAKRVAAALDAAIPCKRVGVIVAGLDVPHAHVHLVPMNRISDLNFANAREADQDELARLAEKIREKL